MLGINLEHLYVQLFLTYWPVGYLLIWGAIALSRVFVRRFRRLDVFRKGRR